MPGRDFPKWRTVAAVSGGGDSVALLELLAELRRRAGPDARPLFVGHVHHGTPTADAGEAATRAAATRLGLPVIVRRVTLPAFGSGHGGRSWEGLARTARREALASIAAEAAARYVVLGHTAYDQAETVLHRLLRGTGVDGLAGMRPASRLADGVTLLRPLLAISRRTLRQLLAGRAVPFVDDPTNDDQALARGRLRTEVLPVLRRAGGPHVAAKIARTAASAAETAAALDALLDGVADGAVTTTAEGLAIDRGQAAAWGPPVAVAVLRRAWRAAGWPEGRMTRRHWRALAAAVRMGRPETRTWPGGVTHRVTEDEVILGRSACSSSPPRGEGGRRPDEGREHPTAQDD